MNLDYLTIIRELSQMVWPIGRISGLVITAPFFSSAVLPTRLKVAFIVTMSWICSTYVPHQLSFFNFSSLYIGYMMEEIALGALMGFVLQLVFQIFVLAGQIISMQAGLSFAIMVDPTTKASVPFVSQLYLMMTTLIFLAFDGHLALLTAVIGSFKTIPIGQVAIDNSMIWQIIIFSSWMWREAILISIPAIFSLLVVSLSIGIMSRVAPQLNIFSLGFPITLVMGIFIIKIGIPGIGQEVTTSVIHGMEFITGMIH